MAELSRAEDDSEAVYHEIAREIKMNKVTKRQDVKDKQHESAKFDEVRR